MRRGRVPDSDPDGAFSRSGQEFGYLLGQSRSSGCGVGHSVVFGSEPVEVVVERGRRGGADCERRGFPVCGHDENRCRSPEITAPGRKLTGPNRIVREPGCSVAQEHRRHSAGLNRFGAVHRAPRWERWHPGRVPSATLVPLRNGAVTKLSRLRCRSIS